MLAEQNIATIRKLLDAVNKRELAALRELMHPDFQRHDLASALPEVSGAGGPAELVQFILRALPDMRIEPRQVFADEERVALHVTISGTHQGEFLGVPGTGRRVEVNGIFIYRLADGKIAETWQLLDVWGLMRQMGAV